MGRNFQNQRDFIVEIFHLKEIFLSVPGAKFSFGFFYFCATFYFTAFETWLPQNLSFATVKKN